jgi:tetratricopeptide (TPR) repeat protein
MKLNKLSTLVLMTCLCFLSVVFAETILLKSGQTVEGKLTEKTDKYIKIDFQGIPLTYFFDEIKSIDGAAVSMRKVSSPEVKVAQQYIDQGAADIEKGQYEEAISYFNKAIAIVPNVAEAYYNRGLAHFRNGNLNEALSDFSKAIEINPDDFEAYSQRGFANYFRKNYNQAIADFSNTIKINPNFALAYAGRGAVFGEKGQYEEASSDLSKAIKLDPNLAEAYVNRALVYFHRREYDKSWADVNRAKALGAERLFAPDFLESLKKVSGIGNQEVSSLDGKPANILNESATLDILNPEYAKPPNEDDNVEIVAESTVEDILKKTGYYYSIHDFDKAIELGEMALKKTSDSRLIAAVHFSLSSNYLEKGIREYKRNKDDSYYKKSIHYAKKYLEVDPYSWQALANVGSAYFNMRDWSQAIFYFSEAEKYLDKRNPNYAAIETTRIIAKRNMGVQ